MQRIKSRETSVSSQQSKTFFFRNPDAKIVKDNKQFLKTVKPNLTDKTLKDERTKLTENEKKTKESS